MARETRRSGAERFKYGICLNDECSKCKNKEVQKIPMRKDFICEECEKELRECPPIGKKSMIPIYGGIGALVVAAGIACAVTLSGGETDEAEVTPPDTAVAVKPVQTPIDTVEANPQPVVEQAKPETEKKSENENIKKEVKEPQKSKEPQAVKNGYGTVNLGYGIYTGDLKDGQPHGHGTIKYKTSHKIVSSKDFVANPGDEFEGDFRNGKVSGNIGYWKHDGDVTGIKP